MGAPLIIGVTAATPPPADSSQLIATTNWVTSLSSGYRLNRVLIITASGTYTQTTGTRALYAECMGGGGQAGGAAATSSNASVAPGASGGVYAASWIVIPYGTTSYAVTIGAGGTGAAAGAAGNAGGDTTFGSPAIITAKGGAGGGAGTTAGTVAVIVAGSWTSAAGSVGDIVIPGDQGGSGYIIGTAALFSQGGDGGGSIFAKRLTGPQLAGAGSNNGNAGIGYGGGGCGNAVNGTSAALVGRNGAPGVIRVWEFF